MGLFSQNCNGCGHPALCWRATDEINRWMNDVVAVQPNGSVIVGDYDGYGSVGSVEYAIGGAATVWHRACWDKAGRPSDYRGESEAADDQGWFFDDGAHDMPDPRGPQGRSPASFGYPTNV